MSTAIFDGFTAIRGFRCIGSRAAFCPVGLLTFSPKKALFFGRSSQRRWLNLQEYQCKGLLQEAGCTVQDFFVLPPERRSPHQLSHKSSTIFYGTSDYVKTEPNESGNRNAIGEQFAKFAYPEYVVKAQILAGGRGKGYFIGHRPTVVLPRPRGVFITKSPEEAQTSAEFMLNRRLVTKQTTPSGALVEKVMVAESVQIRRETYLAIVMDCCLGGPVIVGSPAGGMDIEEVARTHPELIYKELVNIDTGVTRQQCVRLARALQFDTESLINAAADQIERLYKLFIRLDATLVEVNPLAETEDGRVFCIDAKLNFDDNAAFRQREVFAMAASSTDSTVGNEMDDLEGDHALERRAQAAGLSYVSLDGNIGCIVNGAGLAMATMDIIKLHGGEPANFLDIGGGARPDQVAEAFRLVTADRRRVRAVFVNVFGGILRCDTVAQELIDSAAEFSTNIPIVVRLKGTRVDQAKELIQSHSTIPSSFTSCTSATSPAPLTSSRAVHRPRLNVFACDSFQEAAQLVVVKAAEFASNGELSENTKGMTRRTAVSSDSRSLSPY